MNDPTSIPTWRLDGTDRSELVQRICIGGYPEAQRLAGRQRAGWFRDYVRTTIERDVAQLSGLRRVTDMSQLLRLFAARTGNELVMQNVIDDAPMERQAVYDHRAWLETIHLIEVVPAWSRNVTRRVKRRPKIFVTDPGLAAWLLGRTPSALNDPTDPATGQLVETLAYTEVRRQATWSDAEVSIFHWRDRDGAEVDLVMEAPDGRVVGIEVKAAQTPRSDWFRWLARMRDVLGDRFLAGIALHAGTRVLPFGDRLYAVPLSALWQV